MAAAPRVEFHVDFETVSNLDDDFTMLPRLGGAALLIQIGCGYWGADGSWSFRQWSVDALTSAEERRIVDAWVTHIVETCAAEGIKLDEAWICPLVCSRTGSIWRAPTMLRGYVTRMPVGPHRSLGSMCSSR